MNIIVIGNSHVSGLAGNWEHEKYVSGTKAISENIFCIWKIPFHCWDISQEVIGSVVENSLDLFSKNTIVLGFLGSYDIRNNLSKHKNAKEVAKKYAENFKNYFEKYECKVGFILPVPVTNDRFFFERDPNYNMWGNGSREEILEQYNIFVEELKIHSKIIIPIVGNLIDSDFLSAQDSIDGCHLGPEKNYELVEQISNLIINT